MYVTIKTMVEVPLKINSIVRNASGEVVGLFPFGSDADEFMEKCGYANGGTVEIIND